jgi:hypothetical protein
MSGSTCLCIEGFTLHYSVSMQPNWRRQRSRACTCCKCLTECSTCYMHKHTTRKLTRLQTNFRLNQVKLQPVTGRLTPNETFSTLIAHSHIIGPYAHARTKPIHAQSSQTAVHMQNGRPGTARAAALQRWAPHGLHAQSRTLLLACLQCRAFKRFFILPEAPTPHLMNLIFKFSSAPLSVPCLFHFHYPQQKRIMLPKYRIFLQSFFWGGLKFRV